MALRLQENGVDITYQELYNHYRTHNLGRPHFADYMKLKGLINNRQVAFNKYFAKGKPCYIDKGGAEVEDAIKAIESSGGIPIQAHPMSMYISFGKIEETFKELKEKGIKGIEAWHPGVRLSEAYRLEEIAKKMDFICTGGSDFHGEKIRSDRKIGFTAGNLKIQDKFWDDELKPALKEIHEDNIFSI
jgi:predicted metal-dependent phosphoesterase TrpH